MTSSDEGREKIKHIIENFHEPVLFTGLINNWKMLHWSMNDWEEKLGNMQLSFRKNYFIKSKAPLWEQTCENIQITMKDFIEYQSIKNNKSWVYFDYKYMEEWFNNQTEILKDVTWKNFGFPDKTGKDSTIWIGSMGAHTPCHMDTYGCNLIAQIYGRKQWIVFPPEENLRPTRIPYEESSVYSKLNFFSPQLSDFKGLSNARTIILNPGDVLFLPSHWWHYVENLETAISVNVWLPQPEDDRKRVEEAITQLLVSQFTKGLSETEQAAILNPNSTEITEVLLPNSLSLLEKVVDIYKKEECNKKQKTTEKSRPEETNIRNIFQEYENIKIVSKLTDSEFLDLMEQKSKISLTNLEIPDTKAPSANVATIEKLINSICHPEILSQITDKLLKG